MRWLIPLFLCAPLFAAEYETRVDFDHLRSADDWSGEYSLVAGQPKVPVKYFQWLVPYSEKVTDVELIPEVGSRSPKRMKFPTNPTPRAACEGGRAQVKTMRFTENDVFPAEIHGEPTVIEKNGYQILSLPIYPLRYYPAKGEAVALDGVRIKIETEPSVPHPLYRGLLKDRTEVVQFLGGVETRDEDGALASYPLKTSDDRGVDYLVIGPESFLHQDALLMFLSEKNARGVTTSFRTLEDIAQNVTGATTQEKVRNAIKAAYKNDGIKYALLVGNGYSILPSKKVSVSGEGILTDLYFGCLDDGTSDFACEVAIGRAPVSTSDEFQRFILKTMRMEMLDDSDPVRLNELNFGEVMDASTLGSKSVGKLLSGGTAGSIKTMGYPSKINATTFYEAQGGTFSSTKVIDQINKGNYFTIDHLGHANETYCMRFNSSDIKKFTNATPFFAITQGCHPGNLAGPNWAASLIVSTDAGAGAVIANSSFGWYNPGTSGDGPSNRYHMVFYDSIFQEKIDQLGRATYRAKERLIPQLSDSTMTKVVYETNLLGDPELRLRIPQ